MAIHLKGAAASGDSAARAHSGCPKDFLHTGGGTLELDHSDFLVSSGYHTRRKAQYPLYASAQMASSIVRSTCDIRCLRIAIQIRPNELGEQRRHYCVAERFERALPFVVVRFGLAGLSGAHQSQAAGSCMSQQTNSGQRLRDAPRFAVVADEPVVGVDP